MKESEACHFKNCKVQDLVQAISDSYIVLDHSNSCEDHLNPSTFKSQVANHIY